MWVSSYRQLKQEEEDLLSGKIERLSILFDMVTDQNEHILTHLLGKNYPRLRVISIEKSAESTHFGPHFADVLLKNTTVRNLSVYLGEDREKLDVLLEALLILPPSSSLVHVEIHILCYDKFRPLLREVNKKVQEIIDVNPRYKQIKLIFETYRSGKDHQFQHGKALAIAKKNKCNSRLLLLLPVCPWDPIDRFC